MGECKPYWVNCVRLVEHPRANSADVCSEIDIVFVYNSNILLNVESPLLFFTPMQKAASLMSAGILNENKLYTLKYFFPCKQFYAIADFSPDRHFSKYSNAFIVQSAFSNLQHAQTENEFHAHITLKSVEPFDTRISKFLNIRPANRPI